MDEEGFINVSLTATEREYIRKNKSWRREMAYRRKLFAMVRKGDLEAIRKLWKTYGATIKKIKGINKATDAK